VEIEAVAARVTGSAPRRRQREQFRRRAAPAHCRTGPLAERSPSLHRGDGNAGQHWRLLPPRIGDAPLPEILQHATPGQQPMDAPIDRGEEAVHLVIGRRHRLVELQDPAVLNVDPVEHERMHMDVQEQQLTIPSRRGSSSNIHSTPWPVHDSRWFASLATPTSQLRSARQTAWISISRAG